MGHVVVFGQLLRIHHAQERGERVGDVQGDGVVVDGGGHGAHEGVKGERCEGVGDPVIHGKVVGILVGVRYFKRDFARP